MTPTPRDRACTHPVRTRDKRATTSTVTVETCDLCGSTLRVDPTTGRLLEEVSGR